MIDPKQDELPVCLNVEAVAAVSRTTPARQFEPAPGSKPTRRRISRLDLVQTPHQIQNPGTRRRVHTPASSSTHSLTNPSQATRWLAASPTDDRVENSGLHGMEFDLANALRLDRNLGRELALLQ